MSEIKLDQLQGVNFSDWSHERLVHACEMLRKIATVQQRQLSETKCDLVAKNKQLESYKKSSKYPGTSEASHFNHGHANAISSVARLNYFRHEDGHAGQFAVSGAQSGTQSGQYRNASSPNQLHDAYFDQLCAQAQSNYIQQLYQARSMPFQQFHNFQQHAHPRPSPHPRPQQQPPQFHQSYANVPVQFEQIYGHGQGHEQGHGHGRGQEQECGQEQGQGCGQEQQCGQERDENVRQDAQSIKENCESISEPAQSAPNDDQGGRETRDSDHLDPLPPNEIDEADENETNETQKGTREAVEMKVETPQSEKTGNGERFNAVETIKEWAVQTGIVEAAPPPLNGIKEVVKTEIVITDPELNAKAMNSVPRTLKFSNIALVTKKDESGKVKHYEERRRKSKHSKKKKVIGKLDQNKEKTNKKIAMATHAQVPLSRPPLSESKDRSGKSGRDAQSFRKKTVMKSFTPSVKKKLETSAVQNRIETASLNSFAILSGDLGDLGDDSNDLDVERERESNEQIEKDHQDEKLGAEQQSEKPNALQTANPTDSSNHPVTEKTEIQDSGSKPHKRAKKRARRRHKKKASSVKQDTHLIEDAALKVEPIQTPAKLPQEVTKKVEKKHHSVKAIGKENVEAMIMLLTLFYACKSLSSKIKAQLSKDDRDAIKRRHLVVHSFLSQDTSIFSNWETRTMQDWYCGMFNAQLMLKSVARFVFTSPYLGDDDSVKKELAKLCELIDRRIQEMHFPKFQRGAHRLARAYGAQETPPLQSFAFEVEEEFWKQSLRICVHTLSRRKCACRLEVEDKNEIQRCPDAYCTAKIRFGCKQLGF